MLRARTHVFQDHVDVIVESEQRADDLLVGLHDHVDARADALVDELERHQLHDGRRRGDGRRGAHCRLRRRDVITVTGGGCDLRGSHDVRSADNTETETRSETRRAWRFALFVFNIDQYHS